MKIIIVILLLLSAIFRSNAQGEWFHACPDCKSGYADITGHCIEKSPALRFQCHLGMIATKNTPNIHGRQLRINDKLEPLYGPDNFWIQANDIRNGDSLSMILAPRGDHYPKIGDTVTYAGRQIQLGGVKWNIISGRQKKFGERKVKRIKVDKSTKDG